MKAPTGGIIISDNNSGGGTNPLINKFEIPATGRYTVVVTSVANSGTGAYNMTLDIKNRSSVPSISILKGDFQSGLMGTQLPETLEIFVSGSTGAAVAGASVTLVTDDAVNITQGFTAASYTLTTNSGGIVNVSIDLPNTLGEYNIIIQVPGFDAQTISVSSLSRLPAQVIVVGNNPQQDCGGTGCPVGQPLPNPYKLTFLDSNSQPLEGVLVNFNVVSGDGKLQGTFFDVSKDVMRSDVKGEVTVTHVLGTKTVDAKTGNPISQIVSAVASIPNSTGPILFAPKSRAGSVTNINSLKSNQFSITANTSHQQAIVILALDTYGNPVANKDVVVTTNDFSVGPGFLNGKYLSEMKTDKDGYFAVTLTANKSGPTINEFKTRFTDTGAYSVNLSVGSASATFGVDIDLGPTLVTVDVSSVGTGEAVTLDLGENVMVGKDAGRPVRFRVLRYRREDSCRYDGLHTSDDEDLGNWTNETNVELREITRAPSVLNFAVVPSNNFEFKWEVVRQDGNLDQSLVAVDVTQDYSFNDSFGIETLMLKVNASKAKGEIWVNVTARIKKGYVHTAASTCMRTHHDSFTWVLPDINKCSTYHCSVYADSSGALPNTYGKVRSQTLKTSFSFNTIAPRIEVNLTEPIINEPVLDDLPHKKSYSGLDLKDYTVKLNSRTILDVNDIKKLGVYPNYMEIEIDGVRYNNDFNISFEDLSPKDFKFIYYPTVSELNIGTPNVVSADGPIDKAGNFIQDTSGLPKSLPNFEFITP